MEETLQSFYISITNISVEPIRIIQLLLWSREVADKAAFLLSHKVCSSPQILPFLKTLLFPDVYM